MSFSPDGSQIASGSSDGVKILDAESGYLLQRLQMTRVISSALSPDYSKVAFAVSDESGDIVKLLDVTSGEILHTLRGHTSLVWTVLFSPDGRKVASHSLDRSVKLWDVESGEELHSLEHYEVGANNIAFSHDGQYLASSSRTAVKLWSAETGENIKSFYFRSRVTSVAFSPDGLKLATAHDDTMVRLWKIRDTKHEEMRELAMVLNRNKNTRIRGRDGELANQGSRELYGNVDALKKIKEFL